MMRLRDADLARLCLALAQAVLLLFLSALPWQGDARGFQTKRASSGRLAPIVSGSGLLLGAVRDGRWLPWKTVYPLLKGGETYRFYGQKGRLGRKTGSKPELAPASGMAYYIRFPERKEGESGEGIGLGGDWNPFPRRAVPVSGNGKTYREAVAAILKARGVPHAVPRIQRVVRVDLRGDGQPSFLIEAANPAQARTYADEGHPGVAHPYSLVMLRTQVRGRWRSFVLNGDFPKEAQNDATTRYTLSQVLDLNGDGVLEIVLDTSFYEGGGTEVYALQNGVPHQVLEASDGA